MKTNFRNHVVGLVTIVCGALIGGCGSGSTVSQNAKLSQYQQWVENLAHSNYNVAQGNAYLMQNVDCPQFVAVFGSCFGQNPASPYVIPQLPIESTYQDPYYATQFESVTPSGQTVSMFYRLSDNDAMITVVSYPPKAAYFGYQSYLFTRESSYYDAITPTRARVLSPDQSRYDIFGSIGNDINSIIVQKQYGKSPWNGNVVMYITTSNQSLANSLISNAVNSGINRNSIFVEPIGSNILTGNGESADDMLTLMRYAVPESTGAASNWNTNVNSNMLVYRVTNSQVAVNRYGQNNYTAHQINNSESSLNTALQQLSGLLKNYLEQHQPLTPSATMAQTIATTVDNSSGVPTSGLVGADCIMYGTDCEGDNQDTSTYATLTESTILLESDATVFIAGVNHSLPNINNNHYLSIDIYNAVNSSGVAGASQTNFAATGFNSGNLNGSALTILNTLGIVIPPQDSELQANIASLYTTFIARNCNNPTIAAVSNYCINLMGNTLIPANDTISITERSYVLPGQTTGAYVPEMVYPYIIARSTSFIANP